MHIAKKELEKLMRKSIAHSSGEASQSLSQGWDAVEIYFECITTCSLDDNEYITRCVEQLRNTAE